MTTVRTSEREEFLADIITTAIEGGIGYWSQCSQYQYVYDGEVRVHVGRRVGDGTRAVVHVVNEDESGYQEDGLTIDVETIERGLKLLREGDCGVADRIRKCILLADHTNDAGYLDSDDADVVVQAGLLGEVIYG